MYQNQTKNEPKTNHKRTKNEPKMYQKTKNEPKMNKLIELQKVISIH